MMTERNPNNVDGNIPDLLTEVVCTKTNTQPNDFQHSKSSKNQKTHLQQIWILEKIPMKPGAFGALQGNRCKNLQTSGFDVNGVLKDHLPFLQSFHAM